MGTGVFDRRGKFDVAFILGGGGVTLRTVRKGATEKRFGTVDNNVNSELEDAYNLHLNGQLHSRFDKRGRFPAVP